MIQRANKSGFTIVELMLAMSFVSILLLAIAAATIFVSNIYTRGITLREVNQIGRSVTSDIYRTVGNSAPIVSSDYAGATNGGHSGRLCLGAYTYIWNYGEALRDGSSPIYRHANNTPVRFARVSDAGKTLCTTPTTTLSASRHAVELLDAGERNLVIHKFSLANGTAVSAATGQGLHAISFIIGTNSGGESISTANCQPPSSVTSDTQYCAVNMFEIIARSNNSAEGE